MTRDQLKKLERALWGAADKLRAKSRHQGGDLGRQLLAGMSHLAGGPSAVNHPYRVR